MALISVATNPPFTPYTHYRTFPPLMVSVQPLSKPQTSAALNDNTQNPLFDSGGEEGPYEGRGLAKCAVHGPLPQTLKDLVFVFPSKLQGTDIALSGTWDIRSHTGKVITQEAL